MIKQLAGVFSGIVYAQFWEVRIKLVDVAKGTVFDEKPYIAIDTRNKKPSVLAVGNAALSLPASQGIEICNPFSHPRLLVREFQKAERVLQYGLRQLHKAALFAPSPILVVHPREKLEGGITGVECRLFRELGLGAGARKVYLHVGDEIPASHFSLEYINEPTES